MSGTLRDFRALGSARNGSRHARLRSQRGTVWLRFTAVLWASLFLVTPCARAAELPDDPLVVAQWALENRGDFECATRGIDLNLPSAWDITRGDPHVVLAVLDTGVDLEHPELRDALLPRGDADWNFSVAAAREPADSSGHGTCVAGLMVARSDNAQGIAGVAPGCRLMPLKIDGLSFNRNLIAALELVLEFARTRSDLRFVVNGSLSTGSDVSGVCELVSQLREVGVVCFFAAGNGGRAVDFPARCESAIAVGAIGPDGRRVRRNTCIDAAWTSASGDAMDLVAPGVALPSTDMRGARGQVLGDYHEGFGGTSAASPLVAAVAALMLSAAPDLGADDIEALLLATARDGVGSESEDGPGWDPFMGWGLVDAGAAVRSTLEAQRFVRGDVTGDERVDIDDALGLLRWLFGATAMAPRCLTAADAQDDGSTDVSDAIYLLGYLFGRFAPPPRPFPRPGFDPTPDRRLPLCGI